MVQGIRWAGCPGLAALHRDLCAHDRRCRADAGRPRHDARPRFRENPFLTGDAEVRFYAGVPIIVDDGIAVGTLCVLDSRPRSLFADERRALEIVARQAGENFAAVRLEWGALDALTGVSSMIAADRWMQMQTTGQLRAAIHVDIDGLAGINEDHGDGAGDAALTATAARLRHSAPSGALIARNGGDEFAVLMDAVDMATLFESVESIRLALDDDTMSTIDVSMGHATAEPGDDDGQDLISAAARAAALEKPLRRDR